jgi:hypothetical protein
VTTTAGSGCDLAGFSLAQKRDDAIPTGIAGLAGVRAGRQDCHERIVFDFKGEARPGYDIGVASPPFSGSSDIPVPVTGTAFIKVRLDSTRARDPEFLTYTGPSVINPGLTAIRELRLIEDFEAVVIWVIGLDRERSFRVGTLTNPTRIYIDVAA